MLKGSLAETPFAEFYKIKLAFDAMVQDILTAKDVFQIRNIHGQTLLFQAFDIAGSDKCHISQEYQESHNENKLISFLGTGFYDTHLELKRAVHVEVLV